MLPPPAALPGLDTYRAVRIPHTPGNRPGHLDPCSRAVVPETGAQFRAAVPVRCGQRQATAAGPGQHLAGRCRVPRARSVAWPAKAWPWAPKCARNQHPCSAHARRGRRRTAGFRQGAARACGRCAGRRARDAGGCFPKPAPTQGGTKLDARRRAQVSRRTRPGVDCFGTSRRDCYRGAAARRRPSKPTTPLPGVDALRSRASARRNSDTGRCLLVANAANSLATQARVMLASM